MILVILNQFISISSILIFVNYFYLKLYNVYILFLISCKHATTTCIDNVRINTQLCNITLRNKKKICNCIKHRQVDSYLHCEVWSRYRSGTNTVLETCMLKINRTLNDVIIYYDGWLTVTVIFHWSIFPLVIMISWFS